MRVPQAAILIGILLAGAAPCGPAPAWALAQERQGSAADSAIGDAFRDWVDSVREQEGARGADDFTPQLPARSTLEILAQLDSATAAKYLEALRGQFEYKITGFDHRRKVFAWQFYSSIVIFVLVIFLVSAGMYFSWVQFRRDLKAPPSEVAETQLAVSTEGIKVQSSILGVIILVISFLFFYLYLIYVYPIQEIL